jgi:hypothetical protein
MSPATLIAMPATVRKKGSSITAAGGSWRQSASGRRDAEERKYGTRAGKPLQLVDAALLEQQTRSIEKIARHRGDEHLTWSRERRDASGGMHRDAMQVPGGELDFAGVKSRADLDFQIGEGIDHRGGAANAAGCAGEEHLKPIAGRSDLSAAESLDLRS